MNRLRYTIPIATCIVAFTVLVGCGGGNGVNTPRPIPPPVPKGLYIADTGNSRVVTTSLDLQFTSGRIGIGPFSVEAINSFCVDPQGHIYLIAQIAAGTHNIVLARMDDLSGKNWNDQLAAGSDQICFAP